MFHGLLSFYHNYPWIVWTYLAIVAIFDLIFLVYYFRNKDNFKEELQEKPALKVSLIILAILNFFLIIFLVIWLVAVASGVSQRKGRKTCPRCRKYWKNCRCY